MVKRSIRIVATAFMLIGALFVGPLDSRPAHATPAELGCWYIKTDMPTSRRNPAAVELDDMIYVIGGLDSDRIGAVERYDPSTDDWETMAPLPSPQAFIVAGAVGGRIYVIGGSDEGGKLGIVQEYNPATDSWTTRAEMPTPRDDAMAGVVDDKIYVIGGWDGGALDAVEEYDPTTNTWDSDKAPIPYTVALGSAAVVSDTIYVIGGLNGTGPLTQTYAYDPVGDTWTEKEGMPVPRSRLTAEAVGERIYVIGGHNYTDGRRDTVEVYDPASDTWSTMNWMPTRRGDLASAAVGDTIYVFGGRRSWDGEVVDYTQALDVDCDNNPPDAPLSPSPGAGYDEQPLNVDLGWACTDPDGDDLTYDVYFSEEISPTVSTTPALVSGDQVSTTYDPPETLNPQTRYYWRILAKDSEGAVTAGERWVFSTGDGPSIEVEKTASPVVVLESGAPVTFTVEVSTTSSLTLTLTSLDDDIYGDVTDSSNPDLLSTTCSVGETITDTGSYTCTFSATVSGDAGDEHTNTVTARVEDDSNPDVFAEAQGEASVEITDVLPTVVVSKSADPETVSEPGGTVEFDVRVSNPGSEAITLTELVDDVYGDLDDQGTCSVLQTIDAGDDYACTFSAYVAGNAGIDHQNTVTATVEDDDDNITYGSDDAIVAITDVEPTIEVSKTANPTSVPEPGGAVSFTVVVTNTGVETITLATLEDDLFGNLNGMGDCSLPQLALAPDQAYQCSFSAPVSGDAGDEHTNTVTAAVEDDDYNIAYGSDDATVTIADVEPTITVSKVANPSSLPEPGGIVTFTLRVDNTGPESITLISLDDDVYGDVTDPSNTNLLSTTCAAGGAIPADGTYSCTFQAEVSGEPGIYSDTVTATVQDNEGNTIDGDDDATVTITDVEPTITVSKGASPSSLPEPGGTVTFTLQVDNTGAESVTLASLLDDVYGDVTDPSNTSLLSTTCATGGAIPAGSSYSCTFQAEVSGEAGVHRDTVTAAALDNDDHMIYVSDDATVTITEVYNIYLPLIQSNHIGTAPSSIGSATVTGGSPQVVLESRGRALSADSRIWQTDAPRVSTKVSPYLPVAYRHLDVAIGRLSATRERYF
jgi:hypothetical protein